MASSFIQRFLSIFGLDQEKKRVDSEWDQAISNIKNSTLNIRDERKDIILQNVRTRLINEHRQMQLRTHHLIASTMEPFNEYKKYK